MKSLIVAATLTASVGTAMAQPQGLAVIPAQFQGRWAEQAGDCRRPENLNNTTMTITARGWSQWEDGGRVIRRGQVRGTTHYFRLVNYSGNSEGETTMALRRSGNRLTISWAGDGGENSTQTLTRCR